MSPFRTSPLVGKTYSVVGGSIAGLATALPTSDAGAHVNVFERSPGKVQRRGSGLFLRPEASAQLHTLSTPVAPISTPVSDWERFRDGELNSRTWNSAATTWNHLFEALRTPFPDENYHSGHQLVDIDLDGVRPRLFFANGRVAVPDLAIFADGSNSDARKILGMGEPEYAGYVAWRGCIPVSAVSPSVLERFVGTVREHIGSENRIICFLVPSDDGSELCLDWNWHINVPKTRLPDLLGRFADGGLLPPGQVSRGVVTWLHHLADYLLPADFKEIVKATRVPFARTILDYAPTRMALPNTVFIGDAASVVRPHTGAASSKAISDGHALVKHLCAAALAGRPQQDALVAWEAERLPVAQRFCEVGVRIGHELNLGRSDWGPATPYSSALESVA